MARFEFEEMADDLPANADEVVGAGDAADGRIRAVVAADGHLKNLEISPDLLRHDRHGGTFMDSGTLATAITGAVNAALDDLLRKTVENAAPDTASVAAELNEIGATFDRAINDVRAELERAERRLDGR